MVIMKGHGILAHSRSSTSEEFSLFIMKYRLSTNIGKIKPLKYNVHFISPGIFMNRMLDRDSVYEK
jgi:hypothetical protein